MKFKIPSKQTAPAPPKAPPPKKAPPRPAPVSRAPNPDLPENQNDGQHNESNVRIVDQVKAVLDQLWIDTMTDPPRRVAILEELLVEARAKLDVARYVSEDRHKPASVDGQNVLEMLKEGHDMNLLSRQQLVAACWALGYAEHDTRAKPVKALREMVVTAREAGMDQPQSGPAPKYTVPGSKPATVVRKSFKLPSKG